MPWAEPSVKEQKLLFVADCLRGEEPMTVLCERYGISRDRGYVLKRRFLAEGPSGLEERSRAPLQHGRATPAELVVRLIEARKRWPHWGPKKLLAKLSQEDPQIAWPSASTGSEILRREGLSQPRRQRRRPLTVEQPFGAVAAANDAWCIDFKGWFRTGDGRRCDPLTVTDAFSRYLLAVQAIEPVTQAVQAKMGIRLERIWPGKPQQNGRHERMHGTLKPEACQPPSATAARQQDRFDAFRREFNHERPHEALGQRQPAEFYRPSPRPFVEPVDDLDYGPHEQSDACVRGRDQVARLHALRVRGDQGRDRWRRPTSRRPLAHPLRRRCLGPHRSQLGSTCPLWCGAAAPHQSGHTSLVECRILSGM